MRGTVLGFLAVLCMAGLAFAASPLGDWASDTALIQPAETDSGGPDLYGYKWKDSNDPGGPVYAWKDITSTGTLVSGLGDDNYAGPFAIGFPFQYYWYQVTQYWIGSNGYLKFGVPYNMAQPFPASIPLAAPPNDFVAVYVADWYVGQQGQGAVYRWNNGDSLIVSFINIPAWVTGGSGGSHTFQVILSRLDSSLTFQYGAQTGTVSNNDILVGIENANGLVGLERAHDTYMPANYAIYWNSPSTTSYVAHDMATIASGNANSEGFFVINSNAVVPYGKVKNVGNQTEASFTVNCTIQQTGGGTVYNQTVTQGPLAPGGELQIDFSPNWIPTVNAQYIMKITVNLTGDMNPSNDQKNCEVHVMTLPGTMLYDDGLSNQGWSWMGGNGGLGSRFVPPTYPVVVDSIRFFVTGGGASTHPFTAQILDDDGPGGTPGTVLFTQSISTPTANAWCGAVTNITISSGAFYVGWQMQDSLTAPLGTDSTLQLGSRQSYEYTGVWCAFRNSENYDIMIRARIHEAGAIPNVTIDLEPVSPPIQIPPGGGSFNFNASIHNGEATSQTFGVWIMVQLPNGSWWGPALGPLTLTLAPNFTLTRTRTQSVPGSAPAGAYVYEGRVGTYPATVWDSDSFPFTKLAVGDGGALVPEWSNTGQSFEIGQTEVTQMPSAFTMGVRPNPFNPTTTISFALPEAARVTLAVYDVSGRQVAELVNGWRDAGSHEVTFDGSNLTSGIYVYRLTADNFSASGKMVLMK